MPAFPIVDAHQHLWDTKNLRYPWLSDVPLLNKPHLLPDYRTATKGLEVEKMVFVQCECEFSECEKEAEWVTKQAQIDNRIKGMVPWAPLENGDKAREILQRYSENKLIKGIRRIIQFEADPEFCLKAGFIQGVKMLSDYNLSFDICISYIHLANTIQLVKQCPDTLFVLDHIGKPNIKAQLFDPWKKEIKELSTLENVFCKVSGLVTEADFSNWTLEDLRPYFDHIVECFGFDRLIFGGDWPVVTQASSYKHWVDTLDALLSGASETEQYKLYHSNAISFYKL
jgi:L-fuconolactonase